ncbi:MAG: hypothetical protein IKX45_06305 [Bacteroidales bacterium]|nr:hypothetical protein [Bacteroidales bacterium]
MKEKAKIIMYEAPVCITVAIAAEKGILTESMTNVALTLSILDFGSATTLQDGGDLDD